MAKNEAEYIAASGTERHTNAEFAGPLGHGQRHHAVKAHAGENESEGGEGAE